MGVLYLLYDCVGGEDGSSVEAVEAKQGGEFGFTDEGGTVSMVGELCVMRGVVVAG